MARLVIMTVLAAALSAGVGGAAATVSVPSVSSDVAEHGGGCRKASPPGQCCHMETRTGIVHCH